MQDVLEWVLAHWGFCAAALSVVIQFTPAIKWNPLTALFGWIGRLIVKPVSEQIENLRHEIEEIKEEQKASRAEQKADEKDRIRYEVLGFANSCRNGVRHTRDEFQHIVALNDKYERLLKETNDTNGVFTEEYRYIVALYRKCQAENDFLA